VRHWLLALVLLVATGARGQERGFAVNRLDGSSAGSWLFLLERPWYSGQRYGAVGFTVDYARTPLAPRVATGRGALLPIVSDALVGHVDLAGSLFDRLLLSASLPVTLLERGVAEPVSQVAPLQTVGLGDPRVGVMLRIAGQAERDAVSLHVGATGWIPLGGAATHTGDTGFRLMPRAVLAGAFGTSGRWTLDAAFLFRPYASLGPPALELTSASEARAGLALGASLFGDRLYLGPEARFAVQVVGANAFAVNGMNLEVLGGAHLLIAEHLLLGVAGGTAFFGAAGTPEARGIVRLAWAPRRSGTEAPPPPLEDPCAKGGCAEPEGDDADRDGVANEVDRCPYEPETRNGVRDADGCPEFEMERGTVLALVLAPAANVGTGVSRTSTTDRSSTATAQSTKTSQPSTTSQPATGVTGAATQPADAGVASPSATGPALAVAPVAADAGVRAPTSAPLPLAGEPDGGVDRALAFVTQDSDGDGVPDAEDRCPVRPEDLDGFEDEDGCAELDNDHDGLADATDRCPDVAETRNGFDDEDGCPDLAPDADQDGIADAADRCPFEPETRNGVRDDDGCPEHLATAPTAPALASILAPSATPGPAIPTGPEALAAALPPPPDADGDGVDDESDRCPVQPEDRDGFEDDDGCSEADNDDDGVADATDKCPDVAETLNGFDDADGCPDEDPDVDGDGFAFEADRCPLEPGTAPDGCPHAPLPALALASYPAAPVAVAATTAPRAPEPPGPTLDPAADFDKDGAPDEADRCPMSAEDADGFEDDDGCPEPDNDRDGIADATDKCPLVAETINGVADTDGCPDKGESKVSVTATAVVIKGVVRFKTGSANLEAASLPLLLQVAATLRAASSLSVEIQGHTDDVGNAAANIRLSKRRAETIRAVLIKNGVAPARLLANGYGPTRPVASNKTAAGREQNRRVEFLILGESK
jgi:outer membrane protein OmpA-like peptidoglycan-associated protein